MRARNYHGEITTDRNLEPDTKFKIIIRVASRNGRRRRLHLWPRQIPSGRRHVNPVRFARFRTPRFLRSGKTRDSI